MATKRDIEKKALAAKMKGKEFDALENRLLSEVFDDIEELIKEEAEKDDNNE